MNGIQACASPPTLFCGPCTGAPAPLQMFILINIATPNAPTNKAHQLSLVSFAYILLYILEQCYDILFAAHSYCLIYYLSVL